MGGLKALRELECPEICTGVLRSATAIKPTARSMYAASAGDEGHWESLELELSGLLAAFSGCSDHRALGARIQAAAEAVGLCGSGQCEAPARAGPVLSPS